jgi:RimJ/RimL family protein N-acetyltransferase
MDAEVFQFNHACLMMLKKLGFCEEGIKRQAHFDGNRYFDVIVMGLLESDFGR